MKKVFMLLLVVVISVFAVTGCSNNQEKMASLSKAIVSEERVPISDLDNYKGDVAIVVVGKTDIKVEEFEKLSTENLKIALKRKRVFAVGLSVDNDVEVNFMKTLLLKDFNFSSASKDEAEIVADFYSPAVGDLSKTYYWFVK